MVVGPNLLGMRRNNESEIHILDLSGAAPVVTQHDTPYVGLTAFAANSPTDWALGNVRGVMIRGRYYPASELDGNLRGRRLPVR